MAVLFTNIKYDKRKITADAESLHSGDKFKIKVDLTDEQWPVTTVPELNEDKWYEVEVRKACWTIGNELKDTGRLDEVREVNYGY